MPKSVGGSRKTATSKRNTNKPYKPSSASHMVKSHNKHLQKSAK